MEIKRCPLCNTYLIKVGNKYVCKICGAILSSELTKKLTIFGISNKTISRPDIVIHQISRYGIVYPLRGGKIVMPSTMTYFKTLMKTLYSIPEIKWICVEAKGRLQKHQLIELIDKRSLPRVLKTGFRVENVYRFKDVYILDNKRGKLRICIRNTEKVKKYYGFKRFYTFLLFVFYS